MTVKWLRKPHPCLQHVNSGSECVLGLLTHHHVNLAKQKIALGEGLCLHICSV